MPLPLPKNKKCRRCGHKRKHHPDPPREVVVDYDYHRDHAPITETQYCDDTAGTGYRQVGRRVMVIDEARPWADTYDTVEATEPNPCACTGFLE